ncbi:MULTISPECIES: acyl-CoA dehydrogenase family protein [Comamonas]|uniref:acyl-CoA dehydrogenase family protein n=1 Tax=Comamonas TaxID=283 RepID=UPI002111B8E7|nr:MULTISPECIES: acyl-CoA dehydrogenase family protein [Comamonas]UUC95200.1 acyl-CoA dehydrogenase family protein [Comamonas sp. C11]WEE79238.1 acyl-CoA dehydrogenase family protein [Comamonas testosteroni]
MTMLLSQEQELLKDSAVAFLAQEAPVAQQRRLRDDKVEQGFDTQLWQQMVGMGWPVAVLPESHDGLAAGYLGMGAVFEAIGRNLSAQPLLSQAVIAPELLIRAGSAAQQAQWLPLLASGQARLALALDEKSGQHLSARLSTVAEQTGKGWCLSGEKAFVMDGVGANGFVVLAVSGEGAPGLWLVPADAQGVSIKPMSMIDSRNMARVQFDKVELSADMALVVRPAAQVLDEVLDRARACLAAESLGLLREVFDRTVTYLKERVQFDVQIGSFQALQHRAARLYVELELLESCVLAAFEAIDSGLEAKVPELVSVAKAKASDLCEKLCNEAIQLHGGIGVTDELDIGLFFKRARVLQRLLGDGGYHRNRFAQLKGF